MKHCDGVGDTYTRYDPYWYWQFAWALYIYNIYSCTRSNASASPRTLVELTSSPDNAYSLKQPPCTNPQPVSTSSSIRFHRTQHSR